MRSSSRAGRGTTMTADSILEYLQVKMSCNYLSDLHSLTGGKRRRMLHLLHQIPREAASARDWADVEHYLSCKRSIE